MTFEQEQQLAAEIKEYVIETLPLNEIDDEVLEEKIEQIVIDFVNIT